MNVLARENIRKREERRKKLESKLRRDSDYIDKYGYDALVKEIRM